MYVPKVWILEQLDARIASGSLPVQNIQRIPRGNKIGLWVLLPTLFLLGIAVYGFMAWTLAISFTPSKLVPRYEFVGFDQYFTLWINERWHTAVKNVFIFAGLFVPISTALGLFLAILLDQKIRAEGFIRTVFLYPMAISFIVTGTAWKWVLNPGLGLQKLVNDWGFPDFRFEWIIDQNMAVYTLVIAGVWQSSGFAMAVFLAGLRGIDSEIVKAAKIDGAGAFLTYRAIIIPMMRPAFLTVLVVLMYQAIRSFDLVVALTNGGPGFSSELPANFMYQTAFSRNRMALAASSSIMILFTVAAIMVPYIYSELRHEARNDK